MVVAPTSPNRLRLRLPSLPAPVSFCFMRLRGKDCAACAASTRLEPAKPSSLARKRSMALDWPIFAPQTHSNSRRIQDIQGSQSILQGPAALSLICVQCRSSSSGRYWGPLHPLPALALCRARCRAHPWPFIGTLRGIGRGAQNKDLIIRI